MPKNIDGEIAKLTQRLEALKAQKDRSTDTRVTGNNVHAYYRPERKAWAVRMNTTGSAHIKQVEDRETAVLIMTCCDKAIELYLEARNE